MAQQISGAPGDMVDTLLKIVDGIVEASGKPFIKLAWGIIRPFLASKKSALKQGLQEVHGV